MSDVVETTIFSTDVDDFSRLNDVYARYLPDPAPARSAPANVRLRRGLVVSIDAIAVLPPTWVRAGRPGGLLPPAPLAGPFTKRLSAR